MNYFNKLVYKIAFAILTPIIVVSLILTIFLYQSISERTEEKHIKSLQDVVFNYVEYLDLTLEKLSYTVSKDVLFLENTEENTPEELLKITTNNLLADSIVYGSGIIFDQFMYKKDRKEVFFYSYKNGNQIVEIEINETATGGLNYLEQNYDWWNIPSARYTNGWTIPYYDSAAGKTNMVTYYHPFFFDDIFAGVVTIDISLNRLKNWLIKNEKDIEKGYDATTYLISQDSIIIFSEFTGRIGLNVFDTLHNYSRKYNLVESLDVVNKAINGQTGYQIVSTINGDKSFIAFYAPLHNTNWTAISMIPYSTVSKSITQSLTRPVSIIIGFIIFIIIIVILIANYVTKPIVKLSKLSLKIAEGDYQTKINIKSKNEIGVLVDNFKLMKRNLSQREHEISEANKKYEIIFDNSPIGILYIDDKLNIISYNTRFIEILGTDTKSDFIGKSINAIKTQDKEKEILHESIRNGKPKSYTAESFFKKGIFFKININPIVNSSHVNLGTIITIEDITEQTKNTELKIKTKAAEKASESKSLFLANMSHEIRTPMNAIIGLSHLMENTELNSKQKNYLTKINSSAKLLLGIINDILDFSKIEAGKLSLEYGKFNLEQMLIDINNIFSYTAAQKGLEFILFLHPDVPKEVSGDELRLKQIIINLISNSIKFTQKGEIEVCIKLKEKSNNNNVIQLLFEVRDTGIGMTEEQQTKVFGAFSQADESTTRKYGGTGLGLSISKRLVELMDGKIGLKSKPNIGTTFFFDANLEQVEQNSLLDFLPTPDLNGTRVLVCDDNAAARLVVSTILKSFTFITKEFKNGISLLEKLESPEAENYELLILDWHMPELDGIEVAKRIKNSKQILHKPKVILLTAHSEVNFEEMKLEAIDAILYKPVTNSNLFDTIMDVFGKDIPKRYSLLDKKDSITEKIKEFAGAKILLVEDNEINQEVATELLQSMGLIVEVANNGKIATEKILESDSSMYNLVFMDLQMPVMDGFTATKIIRENHEYLNIPIVAMTADVMEGVKKRCLEVGMKDFVSKPINPVEVVKAIVNWAIKPKNPIVIENKNGKKEEQPDFVPIDFTKLHGINIAEGLLRVNNNRKLYGSILLKFANNNENFFIKLNKEIKNNNFELIKGELHKIKGVLGNIGATKLYQKIIISEEEFEKGIPENASEIILLLQDFLDSIIDSIKKAEIVQSSKNTPKNPEFVLNTDTISKIKEIIQLLDDSDAEGITMLEELNIKGKFAQEHQQIKLALDGYDFDKAVEVLTQLIKNN